MSDFFSRVNSSNYRTKLGNLKTFDRKLHYVIGDHTEEKTYRRGAKLNNTHWGQLKLFTNELLFLTHYYDPSDVKDLVYVGAAGGEHLRMLSSMFPSLHFHLFDTGKFSSDLYNISNITINQRYFDDSDVEEWKHKKCLFISDIRTLTYDSSKTKVEDMKVNEDTVWSDMTLQRKWVEEIKPLYSLLKFRLPYAEEFELAKGKTRGYLDGIVYAQPFCKSSSSETRLCVFGKQITERDWDILSYEKKLFHHNSEVRAKHLFENPIEKENHHIHPDIGLYNDYDSVYFTNVVIDYMKKINMESTKEKTKSLLKHILENIMDGKTLKKARDH
jgi:hypothetical protein